MLEKKIFLGGPAPSPRWIRHCYYYIQLVIVIFII